jgi:hypothetical protein
LAAAAGGTVYSYSLYLPRYTMSGQACMTAPYWLAGKLVQAGQCATAKGQEVCPVPRPQGYSNGGSTAGSDGKSSVSDQYDLLQCDLMVAVPASSTYCFLAAAPTLPDDRSVFEDSDSDSTPGSSSSFELQYSGMQTTAGVQNSQTAELLFEGCVSQGGLEFCKIRGQGGPWLLCPAGALKHLRVAVWELRCRSLSVLQTTGCCLHMLLLTRTECVLAKPLSMLLLPVPACQHRACTLPSRGSRLLLLLSSHLVCLQARDQSPPSAHPVNCPSDTAAPPAPTVSPPCKPQTAPSPLDSHPTTFTVLSTRTAQELSLLPLIACKSAANPRHLLLLRLSKVTCYPWSTQLQLPGAAAVACYEIQQHPCPVCPHLRRYP